MQRSTKRIVGISISAVLIVAGIALSNHSKRRNAVVAESGRSETAEEPPQHPMIRVTRRAATPEESAVSSRDFAKRFGSDLDLKFSSDHRLLRVRTDGRPGIPARGFRSGDRDSARNRAQEIFDGALALLGYNPDFPASVSSIRSDEISSQVEFAESFRGVPLAPYGSLTIQLDRDGGLRGLYSTYISDGRISNQPSLDESAAREFAEKGIHFSREKEIPIEKGELILFTPGPQDSGKPVELRYAYRYWIDGREVIVDAADGQVLSERDRRQS